MELNPEKASVFRGGTDFTVKPNEVKIDKVTGLVKPTRPTAMGQRTSSSNRWILSPSWRRWYPSQG
jgi:hypothetical protein